MAPCFFSAPHTPVAIWATCNDGAAFAIGAPPVNEDSTMTPPTNTPAKKRSVIVSLLAWSVALTALLVAIFSHMAASTWPGAMTGNFAAPLAIIFAFLVVPIAWRRRIVPSLVILVSTFAMSAHLLSVQRAPLGEDEGFRVLVFNAFAESTANEKTISMLRETDADGEPGDDNNA